MKKTFLALIFLILVSCDSDENITQQSQTCTEPSNIQIQNINLTSATIIWDDTPNTEWKVEYGETGFTQGSGTTIYITTNFIDIENLTENTTYDAYVKSVCSNGIESDWIYSDSFLTLMNCIIPSNIQVTALQVAQATIGWENSEPNQLYEIEYGVSGFDPGNGTVLSNITSPYTLTGLTSDTSYDFYLRTICDTLNSEWTTVTSFDTLCNGGTYTGGVILTTQQEVDDFGANCYNVITGSLTIGFIDGTISQITSLSPLINITSVGGFGVRKTSILTSLSGVDNITSMDGDLIIWNNTALSSLTGLEGVTVVNGAMEVSNNNSLTSLEGLQSLTSVAEDAHLWGSPLLESLTGLDNLTSIGELFTISSFNSLVSLAGLENLTSVGGYLNIHSNQSLVSLAGLDNLNSTQEIYIGTSNTGFSYPNPNLSNLCALTNLFNNGTYGTVTIANNSYNPTVADIQAGNCSQ